MPKIEIYQSRVGAAKPTPVKEQTGESFGALEARATQKVAREASQFGKAVVDLGGYVLQEQERKETSRLAAELSTLQDEQATELETRIRKGDDPELAENFVRDFDSKVEKFAEGINTQAGMEFFEKTRSAQRSEFAKLAASGQAQVAGSRAVSEFATVLEKQSSFVQRSPGSFNSAKLQLLESMRSVEGLMPVHEVEKLRTQSLRNLAESAVRGIISEGPQGPAQARAQLLAGAWDEDLTSDLKHQLYKEANEVARARRVDQSVARTERAEAKRIAEEKEEDEIIRQMHDPKYQEQKGGPVKGIDIVRSKNLSPARKRMWLGILEKTGGADNPSNPVAYNALMKDIDRPIGDPLRITDPDIITAAMKENYGGFGVISSKEAKAARDRLIKTRTVEGRLETTLLNRFVKKYADTITGDDFGEEANQRLYQFDWYVQEKVQEYKEQKKDWRDLFNPKKTDFLGSPENIELFKKPLEEHLEKRNPSREEYDEAWNQQAPSKPRDPQIEAFAAQNKMDYKVAEKLINERKKKRGLRNK